MSSLFVLLIIVLYFGVLLLISYFVGRKGGDNDTFFIANRKSKWWIVAIGMIGTSISGVSFVSVPGMVQTVHFGYLQTVLGFFFGYVIIAKVLLPLYYKLNLTSIYTYLDVRFGQSAYKTGASFFIISKIIGAAARLYVVVIILQQLIFDSWNIPFWLTVSITIILIWLYTQKSGIKTVLWTDTFQTVVLIVALVLIVVQVATHIEMSNIELFKKLRESEFTNIFIFNDWNSKQNFWKQFLSGVFIPIVMTGLDQDQMQKNLTCRNLKEAQKNMYWYGIAFLPINFIFLLLGAMIIVLAQQNGIVIPTQTDQILPLFATHYLGNGVFVFFIVGIAAAAFSSADSALAALTTSVSIDILEVDKLNDNRRAVKIRKITHLAIATIFVFVILAIKELSKTNLLDTIYTIVGYTYGPLLGLYTFGLFTKHSTNNKAIPYIAISAPFICYFLSTISEKYWGYRFGYELLMLNGLITFAGLYIMKQSPKGRVK